MNKNNEDKLSDNYKNHYLLVKNNKNKKNDEDKFVGRAFLGTAQTHGDEICDTLFGKNKEEMMKNLKKKVDISIGDKAESPEDVVQEKMIVVSTKSGLEQMTTKPPLAPKTIPEPSSEQTEKSVKPLNNSGSFETLVSKQEIAPSPPSEQPNESVQPVNASVPVSETQTIKQVLATTAIDVSEELKPTPKKRASTKKNVYSITTDSEVFLLIQSMIDMQTELKNEVKRIIEKQAELTKEVNTIKQHTSDLKSNVNSIRGEVSSEASSQKHLQFINGIKSNLDELRKENAAHDQTQKRQFEDQEKRFNNIMDTISTVVKHADPVHDQLATLRDRSDSLHQRLDAKIDLQDAEAIIKLREEIEKHVRAELIRSISKEIMLTVDILSENVQGYDAKLISTVKNLEDRCKRAGLISSDKLFG
jgi:hypothetical protein